MKIGIIGGGAAGVMTAIFAARSGHDVVLLERLGTLGKKVLASGGGRCNFTNCRVDETFFHEADREFVKDVFDRFGKESIDDFFKELGLFSYAAEDGRVFPLSNRSGSVMDVLQNELRRLEVKIETGFDVETITTKKNRFHVQDKKKKLLHFDKIVLCAGGKTYPALGSDGSGYSLAKSLGHTIQTPAPITLPLVLKDQWCHFLQGQKVKVRAASLIDGEAIDWREGDLLFTKYGLSGTAIFDCSDAITIALHRGEKKKLQVVVDFVPFLNEEQLVRELRRKLQHGFTPKQFIDGLLSPKFSPVLKDYFYESKLCDLAKLLKYRVFDVEKTRGWNEAEFTAGGVLLDEVNGEDLQSKKTPGLYFAGELLDVQGRRGGYNLAWAWASGAIVGTNLG